MITVLGEDEVQVDAALDGGRIWLTSEDLTEATGWTLKPEGLCRGPVCVPVQSSPQRDDGRIDLLAVVDRLDQRAAVSSAGAVAIAGDPMRVREPRNLHDVTLPDLDGEPVHLAKYKGTKTLLLAWSSW